MICPWHDITECRKIIEDKLHRTAFCALHVLVSEGGRVGERERERNEGTERERLGDYCDIVISHYSCLPTCSRALEKK